MFFNLKYKTPGKPSRQSIVKASTKEEAILTVNNPNEIGLNAEVKEIKEAKRVPKGWNVTYENNGFPVIAKTNQEIDLTDGSADVALLIGGRRKVVVKVNQISGAFKPGKDSGVMKTGVFY